jgi:hypothetical protein
VLPQADEGGSPFTPISMSEFLFTLPVTIEPNKRSCPSFLSKFVAFFMLFGNFQEYYSNPYLCSIINQFFVSIFPKNLAPIAHNVPAQPKPPAGGEAQTVLLCEVGWFHYLNQFIFISSFFSIGSKSL